MLAQSPPTIGRGGRLKRSHTAQTQNVQKGEQWEAGNDL